MCLPSRWFRQLALVAFVVLMTAQPARASSRRQMLPIAPQQSTCGRGKGCAVNGAVRPEPERPKPPTLPRSEQEFQSLSKDQKRVLVAQLRSYVRAMAEYRPAELKWVADRNAVRLASGILLEKAYGLQRVPRPARAQRQSPSHPRVSDISASSLTSLTYAKSVIARAGRISFAPRPGDYKGTGRAVLATLKDGDQEYRLPIRSRDDVVLRPELESAPKE